MEGASRIPDRIRDELPAIVASWREDRRGDAEDGAYTRLVAGMEALISVFIEFLQSPESVETFSRGGAIHALVDDIAESQHELGRDAVGVIEDFAVLRRCILRTLGRGGGGRVERAGGVGGRLGGGVEEGGREGRGGGGGGGGERGAVRPEGGRE